MKVIHRRVLRTIGKSKLKFGLTLLLVCISSCMFIAFNAYGKDIKNSLQRFYEETCQEDFNFRLLEKEFDQKALESKYNLQVEKRWYSDMESGKKSLRVLNEAKNINLYEVLEGRSIQNNGEIVIDKLYAQANKIKIDDSYTIGDKEYKVVGLITVPDYIYKVKDVMMPILDNKNFGIAVLNNHDIESVPNLIEYYSAKCKDYGNIQEIRKELAENYTITYWIEAADNPRINKISGDYDMIMMVGSFVPFIILLISSALTVFILLNQIKSEYVNIGTLYALGYRKGELMNHYLRYPIFISGVGGLAGTMLGIVLGPQIMKPIFGAQYNMPNINYDLNSLVILIGFLIPAVILLVFNYFALNHILSLPPLRLMRGNEKFKVSKMEAKADLEHFSFNRKFKIKEMIRSKMKMVMVLAGICFVAWLMLFGVVMKSSISYVTDDNFTDIYSYKYLYNLSTIQVREDIGGDKNMAVSAFCNRDGEKVSFSLIGIDKKNQYTNLFRENGEKIDKSKVIVSKHLAKKLGLVQGSKLTLTNGMNLETSEIEIDEVAEMYVGNSIYLPKERLNEMIGIDKKSYNQVMSEKKEDSLKENEILTVDTLSSIKESYVNVLKPINMFIYIMIAMSFVFGIIVIYLITLLIIENNTRNISLMKIFGYSRKELDKLIINVSTVFVLLGLLLAIPVSNISLSYIFNMLTESISIYLPSTAGIWNVIVCYAVILASYFTARYLCSRKVLNIDLAYILKQRNE